MKVYLFLIAIFITGAVGAQNKGGVKYSTKVQLAKVGFALPPSRPGGALQKKDLAKFFPPVGFQGPLFSCSSWACAYGVMSYLQKRKEGYSYLINGKLDDSKVFSPLYLFNQLKDPVLSCVEAGTSIYDNLEKIRTQGVCKKNTFDFTPYEESVCSKNPLNDPDAIRQADSFKIDKFNFFIEHDPAQPYAVEYKLSKIKQFINEDYPIIITVEMDETFWNYGGVKKGGIFRWDSFDGVAEGPHALVCVGYNDSLKALHVFNSFGKTWGNEGYTWISYSMINQFLTEAFIVNPRYSPGIARNTIAVTSYISQKKPPKHVAVFPPDFPSALSDTAFFVKNRYQPYNDIRLIPIEINKNDSSGIIKIIKDEGEKLSLVDVFTVKIGETYNFTVSDRFYNFTLTDIRRYRIFSRNALFYTINWTPKN